MITFFDLARQKTMQAAIGQPDTWHLLNDLIMPSERLALVKDGDRWTQARLTAEAAWLATGLAGIGVARMM